MGHGDRGTVTQRLTAPPRGGAWVGRDTRSASCGSKFAFFGAAPRPSHRANRAGGARCGIYGRVVRRKRKMQPLPQRPVSPSVISIEAEKVRAQGILTRRACERPQGNKPLSFSIPFPCAGMLCCRGSELIGF